MWTALRHLLGFLLSKTAAILVVVALVVTATAVWLFARHHLEQRREEVEALRRQAEAAASRLGQASADRQALQDRLRQFEGELAGLGEQLEAQTGRTRNRVQSAVDGAAATRRQIAEVDGRMEMASRQLSRILGPIADTEWLPDELQAQARRWREQLDALGRQRAELAAQVERFGLARQRAETELRDFSDRHRQETAALRERLGDLGGLLRQHDENLRPLQRQADADAGRLAEAQRRLADDEDLFRQASYWIRQGWETVRWWLLGLILTWLFGPLLLRLLLFYAWAPLVERAPPVRLRRECGAAVVAGPSHPAQKVWLAPGEVAIVHEKFLQSSDEPLRRRTQWLWSRRYPFTSLATGMVLMTRLENRPPPTGSAASPAQLTLSSQDEETIELAVIEVPVGGRLACRPHFIAGVIQSATEPPRIHSHWVFHRLHAWITLQFRYFVFHGPVKLVLAAGRGIQVEQVEGRQRRTNEDLTVAFEPWLDYRSRRCETLLAYLRGQNPLFDDQFHGRGTFLGQQVRHAGTGGAHRRFWQDFFGLFFKALGL